jgi:hypothetical protein
MTSDAQSKATGLIDQVRDTSKLDKLHDVFDSRVADAMERLNVPTKKDVDTLNRKLNKILKELDGRATTTHKKARSAAKPKAAAKPAAKVTVEVKEKEVIKE